MNKVFMTVEASSRPMQGPMPLNRAGRATQALRDQGAPAADQNRAFRNETGVRAGGGTTSDRRLRVRAPFRNPQNTRA